MTTTEQIPETVAPELRAANSDEVARQANAVTAIYGLTGSGKSALADTACEYCWETFRKVTLCYANDPGGFGNKRLSLIRLGIMHVWDPTNHVNPFDTMEMMSLGAWPELITDRDRGYAEPTVKLILPRRVAFVLTCPQGHDVQSFDSEAVLNASNVNCPTCGVIANITNTKGVKRAIVKSKIFADVGLRIFDSVTGMNERGLIIELPTMSARGQFAATSSGGAALGAADAFRQGEKAIYGTGSMAQVGFMQNRSYQWLVNIRSIPDQVVPAIAIFGVEQSKGDDESGGEMVLGPKIAGNKRTTSVPGWVGNCCHASKEPLDGTTTDEHGNLAMVHRLWLVNHIDQRRPDKIPYLAKHRGTPLGMPDYLQDPWDNDPVKRAKTAWSVCSLKVFFRLLETQFAAVHAEDKAKYPDAPGLGESAAVDEIIPVAAGAVVTGTTVSTAAAATDTGAGVPVTVSGGRTLRSRRLVATPMPAGATATAPATTAPAPPTAPITPATGIPPVHPPAVAPPAAPAPPASTPAAPGLAPAPPVAAPTTPVSGSTAAPQTAASSGGQTADPVGTAPSVIQQQLEASLAARTAAAAASGNVAPVATAGAVSPAAPVPSTPAAAASIAPAASGPRVIRRPRPPV